MKSLIRLHIVCLLAIVGCKERAPEPEGGLITVNRMNAERSKTFNVGGVEKKAEFAATMEYPSSFGISKNEYGNLTGLVNEMFGNGTNFETTVENLCNCFFDRAPSLFTEETEGKGGVSFIIEGKMVYADVCYFSYELQAMGCRYVCDLRTYDRKLRRVLSITDIVSSNDFPILMKCMREYVKMALGPLMDEESFRKLPVDWPPVKDSFIVDQQGIKFFFDREEWHQSINMEVWVLWRDIADVLTRPDVVPTGKYSQNTFCNIDNDTEWWKFPYEKYECSHFDPPSYLWEGTNFPYASISHALEIPSQGSMPKAKFDVFQSALGSVISHGKNPHFTIREAVKRETIKFWTEHIDEYRENPSDGYGIYEIHSKIVYRGPEYVSYSVSEQNGPPSGTIYSDAVWSWQLMRLLKIEDVIDMARCNHLAEMLVEALPDRLVNPDFKLPEWAKGWPSSFSNFLIDRDGVVWRYWAGDVCAGANGDMQLRLTWGQLRPVLRSDFILPTE